MPRKIERIRGLFIGNPFARQRGNVRNARGAERNVLDVFGQRFQNRIDNRGVKGVRRSKLFTSYPRAVERLLEVADIVIRPRDHAKIRAVQSGDRELRIEVPLYFAGRCSNGQHPSAWQFLHHAAASGNQRQCIGK